MSGHAVMYDDLMAYAFGELAGSAAAAVAAHLDGCADCSATLARVAQVRATVRLDAAASPSAAALARVNGLIAARQPAPPERPGLFARVVAALTFDSRSGYALAGLRGPADGYTLAFSAGETTVDLQIEPPTAPGSPAWQLTGQIDSAAAPGPIRIAALDRLGLNVEEVQSDEHGVFLMDLPAGRYDIELAFGTWDVLLSGLEIP